MKKTSRPGPGSRAVEKIEVAAATPGRKPAPLYHDREITIFCGDCRQIVPALDDQVDLLLTDPPYSRVVGEAWDRINYADLDALLDELFRAVAPKLAANAALYVFAWPKFAGTLEHIMGRHFHVLNHIVWNKQGREGRKNGYSAKAKISDLRNFYPETERIIFAETNGENVAFSQAADHLRKNVFQPLIELFRQAKIASGLSAAEIREKMFALTGKRYVFERHAFSYSQWEFPAQEQFIAAASFMPLGEYQNALLNYHAASKRYLELREQYLDLRRIHQANQANYTDLWNYQPILPGKPRHHPCQKPRRMLVDMINTSSRPAALVLDCFAGSGETALAALETGRRCILIEKDPEMCRRIVQRINNHRKENKES